MECEFGKNTKAFKEGIKFIVDEEDYEKYVKPYRFDLNSNNYVRISSRKEGEYKTYLARLIEGITNRMCIVDHINRNPLDNRKQNLRVCNHQENMMNQGKSKANKTGYKCVHWSTRCNKYRARFRCNNVWYHVGYFDEAKEAYEAYTTKLKEVTNDSKFMCIE